MFDLTIREQWLIAGAISILMLGFGMQHWREKAPGPATIETRTAH